MLVHSEFLCKAILPTSNFATSLGRAVNDVWVQPLIGPDGRVRVPLEPRLPAHS